MARRSISPLIASWLWPGVGAAGLLILLLCLVLGQLWQHGSATFWHFDGYDSNLLRMIKFTLQQALWSTLCSTLPAIPLARALARRRFWGRQGLLRLFSLTLVLPVLVAVFGLITVYGRYGWLAQLSAYLGIQYSGALYGLSGIILAHLFFNLPLATRLLLQTLESLPVEHYRLACQLGMNSSHCFRLLEWPRLRWHLLSAAGLIFMLCFASFATVLVFGGGPQTTTIQVAIYQALSHELNIGQALQLTLLQMVCCLSVGLLTQRLAGPVPIASSGHQSGYLLSNHWSSRLLDSCCILLVLLLLLLPLLAVVISGFNRTLHVVLARTALWQALGTSLAIASMAGMLAVMLALALLWSSGRLHYYYPQRLWGYQLEGMGTVIMAIPTLLLAVGLFLLLRDINLPGLEWIVVLMVNTLMALPYALKVLTAPLQAILKGYERLCVSLDITGFNRLRLIEWRLLQRPLSLALAFACVLSLGDLGVVMLLGSSHFRTLPLYLYQQMGAYRSDEAAVTAFLLLLCCFLLFILIEKIFDRNAYLNQ